MDIKLRIANHPGATPPPPAAPAATGDVASPPAPAAAPATAPARSAESTPRPALQSSLLAAIGRLQIRMAAPGPERAAPLPATPAAHGAPAAPVAPVNVPPPPAPRPVLILGAIPLAKSKSKKRTVPADQQVIPLVLPEYIEPEEVRGRVRLHAQEFEAAPEPETETPAAESAPAAITPAAVAPAAFAASIATTAQAEPTPAAPPVTTTTAPAPGTPVSAPETAPPTGETPAAANVPPADPVAGAEGPAPATPKVLVRPGPDPLPVKKPDGEQAPEESPAERIARIQREDEEMKADERKILKFANDAGKLSSMVEVVLFQNAKPLTINQVARALPGKVNPKQLRQALRLCADRFDRGEHPIELVEIAGGWQLVVRNGFQELIESFAGVGKKRTLTGSIMETLAIIAYRQGTTKVEIETLRGINDCGPHLRQLIEMGLCASGRRTDLPGSPMGYWTTPLFMRAVGIRSLEELGQMGEFTPTEVAGLVEMEVPADGAEEAEAAGDAEEAAAETPAAADPAAAAADDNEDSPAPAIDAETIDAAMQGATAEDTDEAGDDAADDEADAPAGGELFGDAVVIPVDPTATNITLTQSSSPPSSAPTGKAKKTHKRGSEAK